MTEVVVDASAILAVIHREPGEDVVGTHLPRAAVSAVNVAEVGARLFDKGMGEGAVRRTIADLSLRVIAFDVDLALASADLRDATRHRGLSLGDRACLALARRLGLPALTADKTWADLDIGVEVRLIRG